jgi:hypothetical protein
VTSICDYYEMAGREKGYRDSNPGYILFAAGLPGTDVECSQTNFRVREPLQSAIRITLHAGRWYIKRGEVRPLEIDWSQTVRRCMDGDSGAWAELVRSHHRRVYGLCYRFTGQPQPTPKT